MERKLSIKKVVITIIVICLLIIVAMLIWYKSSMGPVLKTKNEVEPIRFVVKEGDTFNRIISNLEDQNIIKSALALKIYSKIKGSIMIQAGSYDLYQTDDVETIISKLSQGAVIDSSFKITFIEGKNMRWVASTIASNTNNTEKDVYDLLEDNNYIDSLIEKYWFLTDEIKDERIYYPLEGYLLPDTYIFKDEDVTVKEIFTTLLDHTEQLLDGYKEEIDNSSLTVHQFLTLASIAELEGKTTEDRAEIIGVFYNRIRLGMTLGSDVTTYYGAKKEMADGDLTKKELAQNNGYNTRIPDMAGKIPVGPICNPSKSAIEASIEYKETDAYYFVADKNGKIYFTKNYDEHEAMIKSLKKQGLWFTYED